MEFNPNDSINIENEQIKCTTPNVWEILKGLFHFGWVNINPIILIQYYYNSILYTNVICQNHFTTNLAQKIFVLFVYPIVAANYGNFPLFCNQSFQCDSAMLKILFFSTRCSSAMMGLLRVKRISGSTKMKEKFCESILRLSMTNFTQYFCLTIP